MKHAISAAPIRGMMLESFSFAARPGAGQGCDENAELNVKLQRTRSNQILQEGHILLPSTKQKYTLTLN